VHLQRFQASDAQVLGISVDSVHSHRAFAAELGGLDYPLLADFHPHGAVTRAYGLWREDKGYSRRAVIVIDREGVVRYVEVIPSGPPDVEQVLAVVQSVAARPPAP
jgi:peroxiredoxin